MGKPEEMLKRGKEKQPANSIVLFKLETAVTYFIDDVCRAGWVGSGTVGETLEDVLDEPHVLCVDGIFEETTPLDEKMKNFGVLYLYS